MIPDRIDQYLREHHLPYVHSVHVRAISAQRFAAAEHVPGDRIAKPVVVSVDGVLALAIVSATEKVDVEALRRATGATNVELVPEAAFEGRFAPCEVGAEPPLGMFGLPMYVDAHLAREPFGPAHAAAFALIWASLALYSWDAIGRGRALASSAASPAGLRTPRLPRARLRS